MARSSTASRKPGFLPDGVKYFLRRRGEEIIGLTLIALAGFVALSLAGFHPADPNFNHATTAAAHNWMGRPGAYLADLLLQTSGLAAIVLAAAPLPWAWRILSHRGLPWFWLHLALLPASILCTAGFLSGLPAPAGWPLVVGLGGLLGDFVVGWLNVALASVGIAPSLPISLVVLALLAIGATAFTLGLDRDEWRKIGHGALIALKGLARLTFAGWQLVRRLAAALRRRDAAVTESVTSAPLRRAARRQPSAMAPATWAEDRFDARVERRAATPRLGRREADEREPRLAFDPYAGESYQLPPLALLREPKASDRVQQADEDALEQNARLLESVLDDFGIKGEITKVRPGPVVTLYELEPAPGTKSSRVIGLADDIARSMSAVSARIAVIPGRNAIGIELPNARREIVYLRELCATAEFEKSPDGLKLALGKDIGGGPVFADLSRMPHLLIAGTTGSGKSVAVNTMILSLIYRLRPDQCRLIMVDPKMLELSVYDGIPHLLAPVVTDPGKAIVALKWAVREMENRYRKMSELGVRNIAGYNQRIQEAKAGGEQLKRTVQTGFDAESGEPLFEDRALDMEPLPLIVVIVDEMADLMMVAGKDIEAAIQRLAQMARAAGLHLIMATQRPSVDVITGTIKANFPTRISFQVTSKIDSRTILGEPGAEQLLGAGDMLFMPGAGRIKRVHGPFVADEEVEQVVRFLKRQGQPEYLDEITEDVDHIEGGMAGPGIAETDPMYDQAVALVTRERKASTSFIQRHLQIGYNRAARIVEQMEADGLIGPANHVGKREILAQGHGDFDD